MSPPERRATWALASIYALRMLGLFLIVPVLSLFAEQLEGSTPFLMGLSISIYGLTQVILQIPFGIWSDRYGRKTVIVAGMILFAIGSVVAAMSNTIYGVLMGRAIQGSGSIAAPVMALVADLTQEVHRTKAMAAIGVSIGISFGVAITAGPVIAGFIGVQGLFWLTAGLSLAAILVVLFVVPNPTQSKVHGDAQLVPSRLSSTLKDGELLRLNYGIFVLHLMLTASFVVVPLALRDAGLVQQQHWLVYLSVFAVSMLVMIPFIILAEKKRKMKPVFIGAVAVLMLANLGLATTNHSLVGIIGFLGLFFCGFNLLEATLPSLVSKTVAGDMKGTAMGVYSSCQFLGAGLGGALGGWCYGQYGTGSVFILCTVMALSWLLLSLTMKQPRYWANLLISLENMADSKVQQFVKDMLRVPGVEEISLRQDEAVAYLKIDSQLLHKEQLQTIINQYNTH